VAKRGWIVSFAADFAKEVLENRCFGIDSAYRVSANQRINGLKNLLTPIARA
jgi:hypothetical protein